MLNKIIKIIPITLIACASSEEIPPSENIYDASDPVLKYDASQAIDASINGNSIDYHGGRVLFGTTNLYLIWYGNWDGYSKEVIRYYLNNFGKSSYASILKSYYGYESVSSVDTLNDAGFFTASSDVYVLKEINDYSKGNVLEREDTENIIKSNIDNNLLPVDGNGIYVLMFSSDVMQYFNYIGFCSSYCGYHYLIQAFNTKIKYISIGDPLECPSQCSPFNYVYSHNNESIDAGYETPNGSIHGDNMISVLSHEINETITDPELDGWFDILGDENADICSWSFGNTFKTSNGSSANIKVKDKYFLTQQIWVNSDGGFCGLDLQNPSLEKK